MSIEKKKMKQKRVISTYIRVQLIVQHDQNDGRDIQFKTSEKGTITNDELVMTTTSMCARLTREVIVKYPREKESSFLSKRTAFA